MGNRPVYIRFVREDVVAVNADPLPPEYPFRAPQALEPPEDWARLRDGCPVAEVRLPSGDRASLLTRYDDVKLALADPRFNRQLDVEGAARLTTEESGGIFASPDKIPVEAHQRWRRLVGRSFTAKRMTALRPRIEARADQLLDDLVAKGRPAELVSGFAFPLPVWVICELLGVDDTDRDRFGYWSATMLSISRYRQDEIDAATAEFTQYIMDLIAVKRADPQDDLISELVAVADSEDGRLTEFEAMITSRGLLMAGHETTANMIGKMVAMLLADRRRWERLLADPELIGAAVEEALRFDPISGFGLPRYLTEDFEVAGTTLCRGTTVMTNLSAANRDERAFDHADEMDLDRMPNAHLTFGAGAHSCLGQSLARTELQTVLGVLLRRLPTLELAVPVEELPVREGLLVGGLERLPVRW
jgi:cytochrome P450